MEGKICRKSRGVSRGGWRIGPRERNVSPAEKGSALEKAPGIP